MDPAELAVTTRASKRIDEYSHSTRTVAALKTASNMGRDVHPGQSVEYVVVDDSKASQDRVALIENAEQYDAEYYVGEVLRAAESVLSPVGWRERDIRKYLADREDVSLNRF